MECAVSERWQPAKSTKGAMGWKQDNAKRMERALIDTPAGARHRQATATTRRTDMRAMAIDVPEVHGHPNRLPFEGVLTLVDVASDKAPSGSRGHRVVLTRAAAETALPTLLGMAVGFKAGWDGHDARQKCGIITSAELDGQKLMVGGYLFARDFPEMGDAIGNDNTMGMSYELADAHVTDMRAPVWTVTRATFTGAAILRRDKAAYRSTSFFVLRPELAPAGPRCRTSHTRANRAKGTVS